jgi:hypothetical protein
MKPRHVAALALVMTVALLTVSSCSSSTPEQKSYAHWHMISPPTTPSIDPTAPLSRWQRTRGYISRNFYESKEDCETALDQLREFVRREGDAAAYPDAPYAQCVSADDPRLKGN